MSQPVQRTRRGRSATLAAALVALLAAGALTGPLTGPVSASEPQGTTLGNPHKKAKVVRTFTGTLAGTGAIQAFVPCVSLYCDTHALHVRVPDNFWATHDGEVTITLSWEEAAADLDVFVRDAKGREVGRAYNLGPGPEIVELGELPRGDYTVQVRSYVSPPLTSYTGTITMTARPPVTPKAKKRHAR